MGIVAVLLVGVVLAGMGWYRWNHPTGPYRHGAVRMMLTAAVCFVLAIARLLS